MEYPAPKVLPCNPTLEGLARTIPGIVYSAAEGTELKMDILLPWSVADAKPRPAPMPCILFIQGSGFTTPDLTYEMPQLALYAQAGYVVATIIHRDRKNGWPSPAFLCDSKTAIRYLRANAETYNIDPARIAVWGTSSGGTTAMLVGLTGDDPAYKTDEYADVSDSVCAVAECFGPSNFTVFFNINSAEQTDVAFRQELAESLFDPSRGTLLEQATEISAFHRLSPGKSYPPFLIMHGTADELVPFSQGLDMYHKLLDCGVTAQMLQVDGGIHEGNFWSKAVHDEIFAYLAKYV